MREKIGEGIASLGPTMTLDTLVEILLISIGTISGQPWLLSVLTVVLPCNRVFSSQGESAGWVLGGKEVVATLSVGETDV